MTHSSKLINRLTTTGVDLSPFREVKAGIPGWSLEQHYVFFHHLLSTGIKTMLVCGVYRGLDLALIQRAAKEHGRTIELTGVDLFQNMALPDWQPWEKDIGEWEKAGFGPPPDIEVARSNAPGATLIRGDSTSTMVDMLVNGTTFDVIYLDTSHDEATVRAEIKAALPLLAPGGVLCGDDYHDSVKGKTAWGVDRAVVDLLPHHVVLFDRIWLAT